MSKKSNHIKVNADWRARIINRKRNTWLKYSSQIAYRVLSAIEDDPDLNQTKLAKRLGISNQRMSEIVKGKENFTLQTIDNLSRALNVELISFPEFKYSRKGNYMSETISTKQHSFTPPFPNEKLSNTNSRSQTFEKLVA